MIITELVLFGISLLLLSPFIIRRMANNDVCFTFGMTNHIKFVDRGGARNKSGVWSGGVFDHMIPEVPGYVLQRNIFRVARANEKQVLSPLNTVLHRLFGVYWYGLYPFKHVRTFTITKESDKVDGTGPENWIKKGSTVEVSALRFAFPRPFVFTNLELSDRFTINLKIVPMFEIVNPYIPIYIFNGDFFTQVYSLLQGQMIDEMKKYTINDFILKSKGEVGGMLEYLKGDSEFNKRLVNIVGLRMTSIPINDYVPGDKEIVEAIRQKALEEEKGNASVMIAIKGREAELINADRDAQALLLRTTAEVSSQNQLTEARGKRIRATVENLASSGGNADVIARGASDILEMEAATSATSKIETLVKDRQSIVVPVGGDKK